ATAVGTAPAGEVLDLDVVLAGQNPSGLAQAVAAVSTPGSPEYRHYVTAAQYAAQYGPSAGEVAQVSSALRSEGLTVGSPDPGSTLLPVSGTASVVSAALGTPLESVQAPGDAARAIVNTASPQIPASLDGVVTGVVGLDGLVTQHSMIKQGHPGSSAASGSSGSSGSSGASGTTQSPEAGAPASGSPAQAPAAISHVGTPQACQAAQGTAFGGTYTSTQLASVFGLDQLLGQGRTGIGQSIAIVEFEQYAASDFAAFQACYGLSNPIRNVSIDGGPGGSPQGKDGEAALDTELAAVNAPSASIVVYEAPNNGNDTPAFDLFNRIASDDSSQVVTTSWGVCEADMPVSDRQTENGIFQRMALQGQTVIAASGDAGSEDCYNAVDAPTQTQLAIDDPGSQPDVVSAGGTSMTSASASSQSVWNDCMGAGASCARNSTLGAAGGGYSNEWPANPGQPAAPGLDTTPCSLSTCRAVPDLSYPSDPTAGGVAAYWSGRWTGFGGTSVAAPTNAGLFVDTNQGCFGQLGRVGPALYAAQQANGSTFTDITQGNDDFTNTNPGHFAAGIGFDAASGLGTPVDPNLTQALQGADGCPSVAAVSPDTGPISGAGAITIFGGGFANASSVTFGAAGQGRIVAQSATSITVVPPNAPSAQCVDVTVGNSQGISAESVADHYGFGGNLNCGQGYRFVASDGGIFTYGDAGFYGSAGGSPLNAPVVGMADTPSSNGYWLVATDGGIFTYGDARFFGSMGGQHLNKPIVGMAATPDGGGYWLVASDGGIFSYGDAQFYGSTGGMSLNKPIVGMASTSDGNGYWLVASDGGIFAYGDAQFFGSTGSIHLNSPVVDMAAGPGGNGYWLVAADGGIFNYGSANFYGSAGSLRLNKPVVGMAATPNGQGYWLVASDGGIFTYGNTLFYGSTGGMQLNKPIVGLTGA
ncbi:MAG TPA: protease pro-enzyme activation domain-containing protein, partial [Acidimicrobiales bacterium]